MKKVISLKVQNLPGVLSHIAGLLASRAYNVDSLTVGRTDDERFSRMTIVVDVDPKKVLQVERQLQKLVTVVQLANLSNVPHVERELALIRVAAEPHERSGVLELTQIFRGSIIDVAPQSLLIELSGNSAKLDAFVEALQPYKIVNFTRSGCIAAPRGDKELKK
ncbi:MAG: acetolactate synthase small subunit [Planctomycetia bacterium]|nr:acetolactate synthase small subunit [Planctomycetia bacterium]